MPEAVPVAGPGSGTGFGPVLVLGGTGTTGRRVAELLRSRGAAVRVASRHPRADGTGEQVRFDWSAPDTHAAALAGVRRLYLVAPVDVADPVPLVEPFLVAARARGVRRVVLLSSSAVPEGAPGLGQLHRLVRAMLPEWTVLRPSWFMQNFVGDHPLAAGIRDAGEIVTATGAGRLPFVDAGDIASVAVAALLAEPAHNTEHLVTGPAALSYADAAALITQATGRPVRHRNVGVAEFAARIAAAGYPPEYAAVLAALDDDIRRGTQELVSAVVAHLTGRPPRPFHDFVATHFSRSER
ncbi:MAG TPA: NAD(P)H-binding protein [Pseudonocardia sp.]|nr:NAD(P)H-binding protein [Pseudonocardia sp.]